MIDHALIGRELGPFVIETTAKDIRRFADAIGDPDPVYRDVEAARAAGFREIPAPPTYGSFLAMDRPDPDDVVTLLAIDLRRVLHAEQTFEYHEPIYAGDRITLTDRVTNIYEKKNGTLEFVVLDAEARKVDGTLAMTIRRLLVVRHG